MDKICVLMSTYNGDKYIKEQLNSILTQRGDYELKVLIRDDGSTDDSCSVIESIKDPRIKLYRLEQNEHISHATNYGFQKVTGAYLARIDSDDIWYPQKLEKQIKEIEKQIQQLRKQENEIAQKTESSDIQKAQESFSKAIDAGKYIDVYA